MRALVRWDPFREMSGMRRVMDRLFDETWTPTIWHERVRPIPVDLYETEDSVVAKTAIPGVDPEDVEISVNDDLLTIKGETKHEEKEEREHFMRRELSYGAFGRTLPLPVSVDAEKATAEYEGGVLTITLPKMEGSRAKTIKISSK
jgi:HSP20 family protein